MEDEDTKLLKIRKVYNRHARENEIRYEDSVEIIRQFIGKIKVLNSYQEWQSKQPQAQRMSRKGQPFNTIETSTPAEKYIPLFC